MPKFSGRKHERITFNRPGFVVLKPDGPWVECNVVDVSARGACIDVGGLAVPKIFMLLLDSHGDVRRACVLAWRRGELIGVEFVTAKQLREGLGTTRV